MSFDVGIFAAKGEGWSSGGGDARQTYFINHSMYAVIGCSYIDLSYITDKKLCSSHCYYLPGKVFLGTRTFTSHHTNVSFARRNPHIPGDF